MSSYSFSCRPGECLLTGCFSCKDCCRLGKTFAFLRKEGADAETALDLAQQALQKLQAQQSTVYQPDGWLYRVAHNLYLDHCRKQNRDQEKNEKYSHHVKSPPHNPQRITIDEIIEILTNLQTECSHPVDQAIIEHLLANRGGYSPADVMALYAQRFSNGRIYSIRTFYNRKEKIFARIRRELEL